MVRPSPAGCLFPWYFRRMRQYEVQYQIGAVTKRGKTELLLACWRLTPLSVRGRVTEARNQLSRTTDVEFLCAEAILHEECVSKRSLLRRLSGRSTRSSSSALVTEINSSNCSPSLARFSLGSVATLASRSLAQVNGSVKYSCFSSSSFSSVGYWSFDSSPSPSPSLRDTTSRRSKRSRFIPWENVRENISINGHCAALRLSLLARWFSGSFPSLLPVTVARVTKIREGGRESRGGSPVLLDRTRYLPHLLIQI